ncbi:MAG TPA: hemolysin family protein [Polyangiales bacterium]|nr:hemolysin family protein [Polyangiales bacterium]
MIPALLILGLLLLNALFVAAEFAIIGVPKVRIEHIASRGSRLARAVLHVLRDPRLQDRYIATAQLGITFASLSLGMYGEHQLAIGLMDPLLGLDLSEATAHVLASACAVAGLTYLHIVLGEMIPKTLALQHAEATALWVSRPMAWVERMLWPLVFLLEAAGNLVLRLFGVQRGHDTAAPSTETLRSKIEESMAQGELDTEAGSVLEDLFAFGEMSAGEVMVSRLRVVGLPLDASPEQMRRVLRSAPHSRYPVYDGTLDRIVGMVLVRDVLGLLLEGRALVEANVRSIPFVPATARLDVVLTRMRQDKTQMVVVMDEQGGTSGIITAEDLFGEVIGPSTDGESRQASVYDKAGELRALGVARIADVAGRLGLERAHSEVDTVSGLVLAILNRPPIIGDIVHWQGMELRVCSVEGRGAQEVAVRAYTPDEQRDPPAH